MNISDLEFCLVNQQWEKSLAAFFSIIKEQGDDLYFHPHPFTNEEAKQRANYQGKDLYYLLVEEKRILAYGMLRGWDEGYQIPSLGICLHPEIRGQGFGKIFMQLLHAAAKKRGANKIRLTVDFNNYKAISLYQNMGYVFEDQKAKKLVGYYDL